MHRGMHRECRGFRFARLDRESFKFYFFFLPPFFSLFSLLSLLSSFFLSFFLFPTLRNKIVSILLDTFSIAQSFVPLLLQKKKEKRELFFLSPSFSSSCLIEYFENERFSFSPDVSVVVERRAENERLRIRRQRDERTTETKTEQGRGF